MSLSPAAAVWRQAGSLVEVDGRKLFVVDQGQAGQQPPVLVLHGFPGSSYDWQAVLPSVARHTRVVAFDHLGYGFSDKPPDARYSLFEYADLVEALARELGIDDCVLVAHDVGDTVAAELLARANEGGNRIGVVQTVLTNGSIFIDMAQLSVGQLALLSMPDEPLADPMPPGALTPGLTATFAPEHLPTPEVLTTMEELIRWQGGDRLLPRVIRYIEERRLNQPRWTAGLVDHRGPLTALWGALDPIAVVAMVDRLRTLRPSTAVVTWADVGHWPSLEVPDRLADAIIATLR
jgi:pimeloyl-ACP methyl ester carboxylesterase